MGKKVSTYNLILRLFTDLKDQYPSHAIGQHISIALQEYGDLWNVTDSEFLFALEKYKAETELNIVSDAEVDRVIKDAQNLDKLFQEEEEDYE